MWVLRQMFPDWFGLNESRRDRLQRCWCPAMQLKQGGTRKWKKSRTVCINVSPASVCILSESISWRYTMGQWWAVTGINRLRNRWIVGAMKLVARYINFCRVRANNARMLLRLALRHGHVSIRHQDYQKVWIMTKSIIDGSRCWIDNILKWAVTVRQQFVVLYVR
jgi:hypothetical protein